MYQKLSAFILTCLVSFSCLAESSMIFSLNTSDQPALLTMDMGCLYPLFGRQTNYNYSLPANPLMPQNPLIPAEDGNTATTFSYCSPLKSGNFNLKFIYNGKTRSLKIPVKNFPDLSRSPEVEPLCLDVDTGKKISCDDSPSDYLVAVGKDVVQDEKTPLSYEGFFIVIVGNPASQNVMSRSGVMSNAGRLMTTREKIASVMERASK